VTGLEPYRDDGPLVTWLRSKVGTRTPVGAGTGPVTWIVPPLLRLFEYGSLITLTVLTDRNALPLCIAFLGVLAFHHYDTVYRLRHQGRPPSPWVRAVGGGWDGRLLIASLLALTDTLRFGFVAASVGLALVYAAESAVSWARFAQVPQLAPDEDGDADIE
jgi:hypothetical protein